MTSSFELPNAIRNPRVWWDREDRIQLDRTGDDAVLIILKGIQKNKKATICPMAPEFAELLSSVPEPERTGPVFRQREREIFRHFSSRILAVHRTVSWESVLPRHYLPT